MTRIVCLGVIFGLMATLVVAFGLPAWLLKGEVLIIFTFSIVYAFTAYAPKLPAWMMCPELRGVTFVALGGIALFLPPQIYISAYLVAVGARLVMGNFRPSSPPPSTEIVIWETTDETPAVRRHDPAPVRRP